MMVIDCSVATVTVSAMTFEVIPFWVAVMLVEPRPVPLASPLALIVAAAVFDDDQVADVLRFWVLPSVNVPVAVN